MARDPKVLALRVTKNRKYVATVGIPGPHVVRAIVTSVVRDLDAKLNWPSGKPFRIEVLQVEDVDPPRGHPKTFAQEIRRKRTKNAEVRRKMPKLARKP